MTEFRSPPICPSCAGMAGAVHTDECVRSFDLPAPVVEALSEVAAFDTSGHLLELLHDLVASCGVMDVGIARAVMAMCERLESEGDPFARIETLNSELSTTREQRDDHARREELADEKFEVALEVFRWLEYLIDGTCPECGGRQPPDGSTGRDPNRAVWSYGHCRDCRLAMILFQNPYIPDRLKKALAIIRASEYVTDGENERELFCHECCGRKPPDGWEGPQDRRRDEGYGHSDSCETGSFLASFQ